MDAMMRFGSPLLRGSSSPIVRGTEQMLTEHQFASLTRAMMLTRLLLALHGRRRYIMAVNNSRLGVGRAPHTACHGDWNYLAPFSDGHTLYTMVTEGRRCRARTHSQPTDSGSPASKPTRSKRHSALGRTGSRGTSR